MFLIYADEIEYLGSQQRQESVIGGAGTYAAIGARLVAGAEYAGSVGWIVDIGHDFPAEFRQMIELWRTSCLFREDKNRFTTKAWNKYGPGDHRAFEYLTPKIRLDQDSLSKQLLFAQAFHLVCSGKRCRALVDGILSRRVADQNQRRSVSERSLFVWEPIPDLCLPEEIDNFRQATREVDIVSPNSEELASFFVASPRSQAEMAAEILGWGIGPSANGILIVREGKNGCSAFSRGKKIHLRAYHTSTEESQSRVIDPTGGGNAFLGALSIALSGHIHPEAAEVDELLEMDRHLMWESFTNLATSLVFATVAASFVIEQPGTPVHGLGDHGSETWNGEGFGDRLRTYFRREKAYLTRQIGK